MYSKKIEIVGLGAGDIEQLPLSIYKKLTKSNKPIYVRTIDHPVVEELKKEGVIFESFDMIYQENDQFHQVYEKIAEKLIELAQNSSIIYAVPGHPMLAEKSVQLLLERKEAEVEIIGGQSYLDDLFTALQIDPINGFQFVDGTSFKRSDLDYRHHLIFCQVYDSFVASNVKLALLEDLPASYGVKIVEAVGSREENIKTIPLEELDRAVKVSNLTSVYVPPASPDILHHTFPSLREVIARLRGPDGCPWDRAQTHESLKEYAIEEIYELIDVIDDADDDGIIEELGDILLQVMLHSQIGEDHGYFTVDDVIRTITDKMIHRHPHVFADKQVKSLDALYKNWDDLKKAEKKDQRHSVLDGVPRRLPALARALKLQEKAAKVGFSWGAVAGAWEKLREELAEVQGAVKKEYPKEIEKEIGDVLFVLANIARYYQVNPEMALNESNKKFISRFTYMEKKLHEKGKDIETTSLDEMDMYWNEAKTKE